MTSQSKAKTPVGEAWRILPWDRHDKSIEIEGPSDGFYPQVISVGHDDVNHDEIERRLPIILAALNAVEANEWEPPDA